MRLDSLPTDEHEAAEEVVEDRTIFVNQVSRRPTRELSRAGSTTPQEGVVTYMGLPQS
jgi:hypothetical protein